MKKAALIFIRWGIFYPITIPLMFIYGVPTAAVFFLWEWIEDKKKTSNKFDSRGAKALRKYGRITSIPYFFLARVDDKLNPNGKRF